jgi:predicted kinase
VDAVNVLPELRTGWIELARTVGARLAVLETTVPDEDLHRRRVEERRPDLAGQVVPTWAQVQAQWYDVWDEGRDGPRHVVDLTDAGQGVKVALAHIVAVASS